MMKQSGGSITLDMLIDLNKDLIEIEKSNIRCDEKK